MKSEQQTNREARIRTFFASRGKTPSNDYLADNGRTRILQYPLNGNANELTAITKTMLKELCDIKPEEALTIKYYERKQKRCSSGTHIPTGGATVDCTGWNRA